MPTARSPGRRAISLARLISRRSRTIWPSLLPKDKSALIVAYCGNPQCPAYRAAAEAAKKLGYKNIKHLTAGIAGWKAAGEKTEKGGKANDA